MEFTKREEMKFLLRTFCNVGGGACTCRGPGGTWKALRIPAFSFASSSSLPPPPSLPFLPSYVNEGRLFAHPTTRLLIGLVDDFRLSASIGEDQETNRNNKREIENFLSAIINTNVMRKTFDFVKAKRLVRCVRGQQSVCVCV